MSLIGIGWFFVVLPVAIAVYSYALYPLVLWMCRIPDRDQASKDVPPKERVTVAVPAYNEERQIRGLVESLLAQDYPRELTQLLIVSDASTDGTDAIVREYASRGVELLRLPVRSGKTAAENAALTAITGDIVVNTDASVRLHPSAVSELMRAMATPGVGVASTRDVSVTLASDIDLASAEKGYVDYEMRVRELETRAGGIVGASGSGYAIRSTLHRHTVRPDLSRDFSAALTAYRHGFRAVSVKTAVCYVPRTASLRREYKRKVRTISRGMETLAFNADLLDVGRHGGFAVKLISHKLCRWLVPVTALLIPVGLLLLIPSLSGRIAATLLTIALGLVALIGALWPDDRRLPAFLPRRIVGVLAANLAVVHASWRVFNGHHDHIWEPTRRLDETAQPADQS